MTKILMVCLGNICRSPLAHGIFESKLPSDKFYIDSAGTGDYHIGELPDHRSIAVAKSRGVDIKDQTCRQFKVSDFDEFDIIYVMDDSNYQNVIQLARNHEDIAKVKLILEDTNSKTKHVPDPYWGDESDFEHVYDLLEKACDTFSARLVQ